MPQYKLLYFSLRGRAEPIRWVLAAAEQPYEDIRVNKETEWPTKKTEVPYGKVPVLYVDDVPLSQSVAICRYLGRQHGLSVEDSLDQARGDEVADAVHDLLPQAAHIVYAKLANDLEKSKNLATEFFTSTLPPVLRELNKRLEGRPWFCGEKMTWVDLFATCYLGQLKLQNPDSFNGHHRLKNLMEKVHDLPPIKKWIKERPVTPL